MSGTLFPVHSNSGKFAEFSARNATGLSANLVVQLRQFKLDLIKQFQQLLGERIDLPVRGKMLLEMLQAGGLRPISVNRMNCFAKVLFVERCKNRDDLAHI